MATFDARLGMWFEFRRLVTGRGATEADAKKSGGQSGSGTQGTNEKSISCQAQVDVAQWHNDAGGKMRRGDYDRARILDYLRMCGVFANQTLQNNWHMRSDCASKMIGQFVKSGLVRKVGHGRYIACAAKDQ